MSLPLTSEGGEVGPSLQTERRAGENSAPKGKMTMIKHTPGPWHSDGAMVYGADENDVVAQVALCPECESNARLITAAPEMYEALKLIYNSTFLDSRCVENQWTIASDAVEAAISKAEGRDA